MRRKKTPEWLKPHKDALLSGIMVAILIAVSVFGVSRFSVGRQIASPTLYMQPSSSAVEPNDEVLVSLRVNTGQDPVRVAQTTVLYDSARLQFIGFREEGSFTKVLADDATVPGKIRLARGVPAGDPPIAGDHIVTTLKFEVLDVSGTAGISLDQTASLLLRGSDSSNVLAATAGTTLVLTGNAGL